MQSIHRNGHEGMTCLPPCGRRCPQVGGGAFRDVALCVLSPYAFQLQHGSHEGGNGAGPTAQPPLLSATDPQLCVLCIPDNLTAEQVLRCVSGWLHRQAASLPHPSWLLHCWGLQVWHEVLTVGVEVQRAKRSATCVHRPSPPWPMGHSRGAGSSPTARAWAISSSVCTSCRGCPQPRRALSRHLHSWGSPGHDVILVLWVGWTTAVPCTAAGKLGAAGVRPGPQGSDAQPRVLCKGHWMAFQAYVP